MYRFLDKIDSPADIKNFSTEDLRVLCAEIRDYMIDCCATNPGHLGSSLGAVELMVALHYVYDTPYDNIVFDVGHQAYAHKIITGRRELFKKNRKKDGISGFPKRSEGFKRDTDDFKETSEKVWKHPKMLLNQIQESQLVLEHSKLSERAKKLLQPRNGSEDLQKSE